MIQIDDHSQPEPGNEYQRLLASAKDGDEQARFQLIQHFRARLVKMVQLRMDRRLSTRIDASDIIQEASIDAMRRVDEYFADPKVDLYVWLRWIANDKLIDAHRFHIGAQKRQVGAEVSINARPVAEATSFALAEHLLGRITSASQAVQKVEFQNAVESALNSLDPIDREVLVLRHFEGLSNKETAEILGLKKSGASKRYITALTRLKNELEKVGLFDEYFSGDQ